MNRAGESNIVQNHDEGLVVRSASVMEALSRWRASLVVIPLLSELSELILTVFDRLQSVELEREWRMDSTLVMGGENFDIVSNIAWYTKTVIIRKR